MVLICVEMGISSRQCFLVSNTILKRKQSVQSEVNNFFNNHTSSLLKFDFLFSTNGDWTVAPLSFEMSADCCAQAFQSENLITVVTFCFEEKNLTVTTWRARFDGQSEHLCRKCLDESGCKSKNCANCTNDCAPNRLETWGVRTTISFLAGIPSRESLRATAASIFRSKSGSQGEILNEGKDYQIAVIQLQSQIHQNCVNMGPTGIHQLQLVAGNHNNFDLLFSATQSQLIVPNTNGQALVCLIELQTVDGEIHFNSTTPLPPLLVDPEFSAFDIPLMYYDEEMELLIVFLCSMGPPSSNFQWTLSMRLTFLNFNSSFELEGLSTECPVTVSSTVRSISDSMTEVFVVLASETGNSLNFLSIILDCNETEASKTCNSVIAKFYEPYFFNSTDLPIFLVSAGSYVQSELITPSSAASLFVVGFTVALPRSKFIALLVLMDWSKSFDPSNLSMGKEFQPKILISPNFVTMFPNAIINFNRGENVNDIVLSIFNGGILVTYCLDGGECQSTMISGCEPGDQFSSDHNACVSCPAGQFKNNTFLAVNCDLCPAGTYNPEPGARALNACLYCDPGSTCSAGFSAPQSSSSLRGHLNHALTHGSMLLRKWISREVFTLTKGS